MPWSKHRRLIAATPGRPTGARSAASRRDPAPGPVDDGALVAAELEAYFRSGAAAAA